MLQEFTITAWTVQFLERLSYQWLKAYEDRTKQQRESTEALIAIQREQLKKLGE